MACWTSTGDKKNYILTHWRNRGQLQEKKHIFKGGDWSSSKSAKYYPIYIW